MAKFYQRYFPVPPISQVQYGYRGSNYTVNGQQYDNITNLQLVGNYQITCSIGDCNAYVSNFSVDSLFEPSLMGSIYDLSGSRFSGDYTAGTFNSSNTTYIGVNNWSFKNHGFCNIVNYTVQTSNSCPAFTGCVTSNNTCINPPCYCYFGTTRACCWVYPASAFSGLYCCNLNNFVQIEAPSGTINNFVPVTTPTLGAGGLHYYWGGTTIFSAACAVLEPTSGDSCQGFYPSKCGIGIVDMGGCTQCWWGWSDHCCQFFGAESSCVGDAVYFGGKYNHLCSNANGGQWCAQHIWGSHPVYNGSGGTAEYGMRTFITRSGTKTWYFHYNSANGGIQGSDTSASTLNRLSLRLFDSSNNTTTISNTFLKGLSGLVIPSQPDQDDGTGYRYYFIRFNGTDVKTITIYRILHTYASSVTTTTAYSLSMSSGEQAAIYTNAGHDNTYFSKLNNPAFRRQNVQRIWYSIDSNSVKRLHLGIYNTNGTQLVVGSSGFNDANSTGAMFKIYSWSLDDGASGATYLGNISLHTIGPRYFCPLNTNWTVIYMGSSFGNDAVYTLNATTGLYQYGNTMPYAAARLFKDKDGRWSAHVIEQAGTPINGLYNNYFDIITTDAGQTLTITAATSTYTYSGSVISGSVLVNVYNYLGNRIVATVNLTIIGSTNTPGITFTNGLYTQTVTTSSSADTSVGILVVSSASAKIVGAIA